MFKIIPGCLFYFYSETLAFFLLLLIFLNFEGCIFLIGQRKLSIFYHILYIFCLSSCSPTCLESILHFFSKFHQLFLLFCTGFSKFASWFLMSFVFSGVSGCLLFKPLCLYHSFRYFQAVMEESWVMPSAVSHHNYYSKEGMLLKYYPLVLSYSY